MAIANLPTFSDGEVLTAAKLNSLVAAIQAKHNGATGPEDMPWPLTAQGNIDMADYEIDNLPVLWNVYNLAERPSSKTVQDVLDDIDAAGGGVAYIPADTTISADNLDLHPNTRLLGANFSSVLAAPATPTGPLLNVASPSDADIVVENLQLDGTSVSSGSHAGLELGQANGFKVLHVKFAGFQGPQLYVTNDGTAGNNSQSVRVMHCQFTQPGANVEQMQFDDVDDMLVFDCDFDDPTQRSIYSLTTNASQVVREVKIKENRFKCDLSNGEGVIEVDGGFAPSATASPTVRRHVHVDDNKINGSAAAVGGPAIAFKHFAVFSANRNEIRDYNRDGIAIGTNGSHVVLGSRVSEPCYTYSVSGNEMHEIGHIAIVICSPTGRGKINDNIINESSALDATTYHSIEFWNVTSTEDFRGTVVVGNVARNNNAAASPSLGGAVTYQGFGPGSTAGANIGGGASGGNFLMAGNDLEGWDVGANDWTPGAARRVVDGGNNF